jgi:hypothetical protein
MPSVTELSPFNDPSDIALVEVEVEVPHFFQGGRCTANLEMHLVVKVTTIDVAE